MDAISIVPAAPADKATVANLVQLYLYDMTEESAFPVGADGRFEYDFLERFWQHPYLIKSGDELAGFALVIDECPITGDSPCHFMAEFFVLRAYRGRGVGREVLNQMLARHPGRWHIGVVTTNHRAAAFWEHCLDTVAGVERLERDFDGYSWLLRRFVA